MPKLLHVLIKKNDQEYHIPFNKEETETTTLYDAYQWAIKAATSKDWIETDNGILDLGTSTEYDHIKVWYEGQDDLEVEEPTEPEPQKDYFERTKVFIAEYLGQKLRIKGLEARYLGHDYYLPMEINDRPALEALDNRKLKALLMAILPAHVAAIVPPAQLPDYEEAEDYIIDLGEEKQKELERYQEVKDKNATAYFGFSEK